MVPGYKGEAFMFHRCTSIFGLLLLALSATGLASAQYYVTDLGVVGSGTRSWAMAVNDSGVVAGASATSKGSADSAVATIYTGGAWVDIGTGFNTLTAGTGGTFATGINDNGQVTGWLRTSNFSTHPNDSFIYNTNTATYTDIGAQPGVCNGAGNQCGYDTYDNGNYTHTGPINSSGQIAGVYSSASSGDNDGFIWNGSSTTAVTTPATDAGATYVSAINNSGVVVGTYQVGITPVGVGFYFNGSEHDIHGMTYPEAIAGNYVVGTDYYTNFPNGEAIVYTLGASSATPIGTLNGDTSAVAYGVNSSGRVVGASYETSGLERAFVYSNGLMSDLNTLICGPNPFSELNSAMGISANGEYIVGNGTVASNGETIGFLLSAAIPGDANGDGRVDINDLTIVLAHYGQSGQTWADGEFTGDGTVDINDLTIVLAHYGDTFASSAAGSLSAVPEPGALALLAVGVAGLLTAWRRVARPDRAP
jgi:probable HAF family extracellular repeat protein